MKTRLFALVALLLLCGLMAAVSLPPVLVGYLEPNLSISVQVLNDSQGSAYVLSINGQEKMVASDWNNQLVSDPAQISALLKDDIARSSGFANAQASLGAAIIDLQARRAYPESQCALLTGTDHLPCVDKHSCVVAAQANPQAVVLYQADGFVEAMQDEVQKRGDLNRSVQALVAANASATATASTARAIASDMGDVSSRVQALYSNNLFLNRTDPQCLGAGAAQCFEYCPKINWTSDGSGWTALQSRFNLMATSLDALPAQDARAAALAKASADWTNYSQNKGIRWSQMKTALAARQGTIDNKLGNATAKLWNDAGLSSDYAAWKAQVQTATSLADGGQFYAALQMQNALMATADNISARVDANNAAVAGIQSNLQAIDKSLAALQAAHANATDLAGLNQSDIQLKASIHYPIAAEQLPILANQSSRLEQLVLAQVGQMTLGVPPVSSGNVSAQAGAIVGPNATGAGAVTSAVASASASPLASLKKMGCPLPVALALLAALAAWLSVGSARWQDGAG